MGRRNPHPRCSGGHSRSPPRTTTHLKPVDQGSVSDWDRVLAVNLRAPFLLSRAAFPHVRRRGGGTIINVSSVAGRRGWANAAAYCSSKFGLTGLTQAIAAEGREHGIRATVLYPGAMATAWGAWGADERQTPQSGEPQTDADVLPPEQVADFIAWILVNDGRKWTPWRRVKVDPSRGVVSRSWPLVGGRGRGS